MAEGLPYHRPSCLSIGCASRRAALRVWRRWLPTRRRAIWNALPLEARADRRGDESYAAVPVELSADEAREVVGGGDVAYWPPGQAVCIFWGVGRQNLSRLQAAHSSTWWRPFSTGRELVAEETILDNEVLARANQTAGGHELQTAQLEYPLSITGECWRDREQWPHRAV